MLYKSKRSSVVSNTPRIALPKSAESGSSPSSRGSTPDAAKAIAVAPVQEDAKDLKQGHQEGGADSDGKNFADAGINHQVQVNP